MLYMLGINFLVKNKEERSPGGCDVFSATERETVGERGQVKPAKEVILFNKQFVKSHLLQKHMVLNYLQVEFQFHSCK